MCWSGAMACPSSSSRLGRAPGTRVGRVPGPTACNDFSIGIELEGTDDTRFEDAQYDTLSAVIAALLACYPTLDPARIVGHSDIAPGRKFDPGVKFDWPRLRALVAQSAPAAVVPP